MDTQHPYRTSKKVSKGKIDLYDGATNVEVVNSTFGKVFSKDAVSIVISTMEMTSSMSVMHLVGSHDGNDQQWQTRLPSEIGQLKARLNHKSAQGNASALNGLITAVATGLTPFVEFDEETRKIIYTCEDANMARVDVISEAREKLAELRASEKEEYITSRTDEDSTERKMQKLHLAVKNANATKDRSAATNFISQMESPYKEIETDLFNVTAYVRRIALKDEQEFIPGYEPHKTTIGNAPVRDQVASAFFGELSPAEVADRVGMLLQQLNGSLINPQGGMKVPPILEQAFKEEKEKMEISSVIAGEDPFKTLRKTAKVPSGKKKGKKPEPEPEPELDPAEKLCQWVTMALQTDKSEKATAMRTTLGI